jgi:hypothetical protein
MKYAKCMINGFSISRCAEEVDISITTSFYWRHKILDAIRAFMGIGKVAGVVEADETYYRVSYKGNHKKSRHFTMPRAPRKRGKEVKTRGLSKEYVCVGCAIDREGNVITEVIGKGRAGYADLKRLLDDRIGKNSIYYCIA